VNCRIWMRRNRRVDGGFTLIELLYAGEDSRGRLPAFELPTQSSRLKNFVNPWIVALPMFKAMEAHGVTQPRMWFCPLRQRWQSAAETVQWKFGRPMATMDDYSSPNPQRR
jgi:hypothetical protein